MAICTILVADSLRHMVVVPRLGGPSGPYHQARKHATLTAGDRGHHVRLHCLDQQRTR